MDRCPYCGGDVRAVLCSDCGRHRTTGCVDIVRVGTAYAAGRTADARAGVWDIGRGGPPVETYPDDKAGWAALWAAFETADKPAAVPAGRSELARWLRFAVTVIVLVVAYIMIHYVVYSGCLNSPGLFEWTTCYKL